MSSKGMHALHEHIALGAARLHSAVVCANQENNFADNNIFIAFRLVWDKPMPNATLSSALLWRT